MLHLEAQARAIGVDPLKPGIHARKQLHLFALTVKGLAAQTHAPPPGLENHHIHIGQDGIHVMTVPHVPAQPPEIPGLHAQLRDERIFLHIPGG